jgi:hypothetical protein
MNHKTQDDDTLNKLQRDTFDYFLKEANPLNGLRQPHRVVQGYMPVLPEK